MTLCVTRETGGRFNYYRFGFVLFFISCFFFVFCFVFFFFRIDYLSRNKIICLIALKIGSF